MNTLSMKTSPMLLSAAIALALSGAAQAQSGSTGSGTAPGAPPAATTPGTSTSPGMNAPAARPAAPRATEATHALKAVRLSKLDGVDIQGGDGKKIGEIDDVVIDPRSGSIQYAVVSAGGVMGIGDKKHQVPLKEVKFFSRGADDNEPRRATVSGDVKSMPAAPKLDRDSPSVAADKMLGTDIVDVEGKKIGEIEDVIVDLQSGQAQYALVEFDKAWSPVDKLFAFRLSDLQPAKDRGKMMVSVRKEALENQPGIEKSRLDTTDLSDLSWASRETGATMPGGATPPATGSGTAPPNRAVK